jgi:hypothetical protein
MQTHIRPLSGRRSVSCITADFPLKISYSGPFFSVRTFVPVGGAPGMRGDVRTRHIGQGLQLSAGFSSSCGRGAERLGAAGFLSSSAATATNIKAVSGPNRIAARITERLPLTEWLAEAQSLRNYIQTRRDVGIFRATLILLLRHEYR